MKHIITMLLYFLQVSLVYPQGSQVKVGQKPIKKDGPQVSSTTMEASRNNGSLANYGTTEQNLLEIISDKDMIIMGSNGALMAANDKMNQLQRDQIRNSMTLNLLVYLNRKDLDNVQLIHSHADQFPIITELRIVENQLQFVSIALYKNELYDDISKTVFLLINELPVLHAMYLSGQLRLTDMEQLEQTVSPNQIIIPVFPKIDFSGIAASRQYLDFIHMLVNRYQVPQDVLNAYLAAERQNIPDGNESRLVEARKLFILYLHAKYKK